MTVLRLAAEKGSLQSLAPLFKTRLEHVGPPNLQYHRLLVYLALQFDAPLFVICR